MFTTDICKASVDPKWSSHYDLYLSRGDGITISVWNQKKIHKTQGSGFLGCVRITASTVQRLKDTGCKYRQHKQQLMYSKFQLVSFSYRSTIRFMQINC